MLKGKTKSGFEFQVDEKLLDDMELLEAFAEAMNDQYMFPKVLKRFLGEDQKIKLYDHMRTKKGNVPIEKTMDEFIEIMDIIKGEQSKNS